MGSPIRQCWPVNSLHWINWSSNEGTVGWYEKSLAHMTDSHTHTLIHVPQFEDGKNCCDRYEFVLTVVGLTSSSLTYASQSRPKKL
jgi:hypothetical protein